MVQVRQAKCPFVSWGQPGIFRLTIGSYRVIFRYSEEHILVTHLDPRGQAYKKRTRGRKDDSGGFEKRNTQLFRLPDLIHYTKTRYNNPKEKT